MPDDAPSISVVITAPKGLPADQLPDWLLAEADGDTLEIVIADGAESAADDARSGLVRVHAPCKDVFALRRLGLLHASKDWVLLIEEHCTPLPGWLEAFRAAIAGRKGTELFSGCVQNEISTSSWSWANLLQTGYVYSPLSRRQPRTASISNLALRRGALSGDDLSEDGMFETVALPRLARSGNFRHCAEARVDHFQPRTLKSAFASHYNNARCHGAFRRHLDGRLSHIVPEQIAFAAYACTLSPLRILFSVRGSEQCRLSHFPRLILLGFAGGLGRLRGLISGPGQSAFQLD